MTESEQQAAEINGILDSERERQKTLKMIVANGGSVWDSILERWVEAR